MEYFVDMTTHVPTGTPEETVDDIRGREAARARELAADGRLLRLWRPPLAPGEWRTFGLFAAEDDRELDETLASMPLHVWRTDVVTPLLPHPNDPRNSRGAEPAEFLTMLTLTVPEGTPDQAVERPEGARSRYALANWLTKDGWSGSGRHPTNPAQWRTLGLWSARDSAGLTATLESLPLHVWMTVESTPLTPHPNDPVLGAG